MKIRFQNKLLACLLFLASFTGCVKLKEVPEGIISPNNFYKADADFKAAINGTLKSYFGAYGAFDFNNHILLCGGADDVTSRPTAPELRQYDIFKPDLNGFQAAQEWKLIYQAINSANLIISNVGNSTISSDNKKMYEGQARYLRALGYFYLTRWFGEIPIITAENQSNAINIEQSSVKDVYDFIVNDLKIASDYLPLNFPEKGRPTKGAAKTLLAEVYLNMAGWPLKDASKYALARDEAKGVMDLGIYDLEQNFADIWKVSNKLTSKELIFMFMGSSKGHLCRRKPFACCQQAWRRRWLG